MPFYHAADCLIQINEIVSAIFFLDEVIRRSSDDPHWEQVKTRALALQQKLQESSEWSQAYEILNKEEET